MIIELFSHYEAICLLILWPVFNVAKRFLSLCQEVPVQIVQ